MPPKIDKLTPLGIKKLLASDAENEEIVVQVFDIKMTKNGKIICIISDGQFYTKAYLNDDSVIKPGTDELSIININTHGVLNTNIGITQLKFVSKYPQKLGTPNDWANFKQNASELKPNQQFKLQKIMKTEQKKVEIPSAAKTSTGRDQDYESIDNLYIGMSRWTLLCRISSKKFRQSSKKGTKILEIQLVDKSKKRIIGTFFGQAAVDFNDYLKQGSVYQISKGRLIQGNYNNSKNEKLSCYALVFDGKAQFNQVSDVNIIVKAQDSAITLGNVYQKRIFNQQFDVVAYVLQVKEQVKHEKQNKTFTTKQVVLADPQAQIIMNARLWRWNQHFGNEMVGKVLIFSRFIMKQYKGSININSGIRSSITTHHNHPMKMYENKKIDPSSFKITTQTREKTEEDTSDFCYTTIQLYNKIQRMSEGDTIKSVLNVWINRFAYLKKWSYQACPKCKKVAEKYSKCPNPNCGEAIQQTTLKFTMGVQISDFFGSLWVTAYDELAKAIFQDMGGNAAKKLQQLSKDQLGEKLQNYLYQPYRLKILTKSEEGRIRHNVGRVFEMNEQKIARDNLRRINQLMNRSQ